MLTHSTRASTPLLLVAGALLLACGDTSAPSATSGSPSAPAETTEKAPAPPATPPPAIDQLHSGIDVSTHSGTVDWPAVAQEGHGFAFAKATEGMDLKDSAFDQNWPAIKAAGLLRGAYHFYVTEDDPEKQAQFFIENVALSPGDLAPVVDIETIGHNTQPGLADRLKTCLDLLEEHYGVKPIIYTAPNFWNEHFDDSFGAYPLWVAEYEVDEPRKIAGWAAWHLWQWKADAKVNGVEQSADLSRANRSGVDLSALIIPSQVP